MVVSEFIGEYFLQLLKPIPMIIMIIYICGKNAKRDDLVPTLIWIGLIFSLFGDLYLMSNQLSVGAKYYFIGHILSCVAFSKGKILKRHNNMFLVMWCIISLGILVYNIKTLWIVMPDKLFFSSYAVILFLKNILAVKRYDITNQYSFNSILVGTVLFGLTDTPLAMLKFHSIIRIRTGFDILFNYIALFFMMHGAK